MPKVHNAFVDLNFTHTRLGALVVTASILWLCIRTFRLGSGEARLTRPALLLLVLTASQIALGVFVIWNLRPPVLTTLHVVNGAALFAATVLLAVRAGRFPNASQRIEPTRTLIEVAA